MKKLLYAIFFVALAVWVVGKLPLGASNNRAMVDNGASETASASGSPPAPEPRRGAGRACTTGAPASGAILAVTGEYELRTSPAKNGDRIKNQKASSIIGKTIYHRIDPSTTVRQVCAEEDWSEVEIVTPEWLAFVRGWVPNGFLRDIERTASGTRVYVAEDFFWDKDSSKYKQQIVAVANKIAQEHAGCSALDTATIALSPSRSKPNDPVFFVTCNPPSGMPFNVWFRPSDTDRAFPAARPIAQGDAILACEAAAKAAATHPSTVDFSRFLDVAYSKREDGHVALDSSFMARNAFNLEQKYRIRCLFDGSTLIESNITEAG